MGIHRRSLLLTVIAGILAIAGGFAVLAERELDRLREAFDTDGRIIHRLLSQRAAQHDAVLSMLTLLQPSDAAQTIGKRIAAVYPQILDVQQRPEGKEWPESTLQAAESESRRQHRPAAAANALRDGRLRLVQAGHPASHALLIDWHQAIPWDEWPLKRDDSAVTIALIADPARMEVQPGKPADAPWQFEFRKRLANDSQPFEVVATLPVGWSALPWTAMLLWSVLVIITIAGIHAYRQQQTAQRRAEELLRLGQISRLNALGELAAGLAHEINQPLTAILASTQAAQRLLDDDTPDHAQLREAMTRSVEQAKRAAAVLARLRRSVERPQSGTALQSVPLAAAARNVLHLLEPECRKLGVEPLLSGKEAVAHADPVALEQIVHNLIGNALQALALVAPSERQLHIEWQTEGAQVLLRIADSGPGIAAEALPRLFEPFYTTRENGLGLGLSLCESLAGSMQGQIKAENRAPRGAVFTLMLPKAEPA